MRIKRADGQWYLGLSNKGLEFTPWKPHAACYDELKHALGQIQYLKSKGFKVKLDRS